jgi:3-oxoacyl-[acyl-carrier protein] reductase
MGKVIIISGTRKGIGNELAKHYLKQNCFVAGCSRGNTSIDHPNYTHYQLDIADEKAVVKMIRDIYKKYHKIDILLNNAGIASMNHLILTPIDNAHRVFNTNFFGSFVCLREAAKIMMKQKFGRIVNFSTVAVPLRLEGEAIYSASKSAVETLTQIAAKELSKFGITVNAIGPTPVQTDLTKSIPKEKIDALLNKQAIQRFGEFDDIANVIDFFIDDKSNFVTGQIIYLGGVNG